MHVVYVQESTRMRHDTLHYGGRLPIMGNSGEKELLNKVIIFVFFAHKMYSPSVTQLKLNL